MNKEELEQYLENFDYNKFSTERLLYILEIVRVGISYNTIRKYKKNDIIHSIKTGISWNNYDEQKYIYKYIHRIQ